MFFFYWLFVQIADAAWSLYNIYMQKKKGSGKKMIVVAHGKVDAYCEEHGMVIGSRYEGKLEKYSGDGLIVVTDNCADKNDYYYLKYMLRMRGIELVSIWWHDQGVEEFLEYKMKRDAERRGKRGGRRLFGLQSEEAMAVVRRIFELRDAGLTLRQISEDPGVRYMDGRKMPISTIQVILKNRGRYEE